ncbi:pyridoxamine 5'-phosphate oxidase family protein [Heliophilum fasciatum]|uniref:Pyridoxamine 5'-phosphate oxidase n=1 Tax=Heliophilum fasciatum TaxID=35700 RepID=A0A4R2RJK4_9FIRM|nr:pyridoxamine 5'-phosphate oxidase family protein [Heliophilum fasciatum]MCW2278599.1 hypothetical protein [Heliophilum fasciatum]TCP62699.1 pyridoxamine 5'-phosphate oxidase [Heliophilum fasciatum]
MTLKKYFEEQHGIGILATADEQGQVNTAVYDRPLFMDDGTLAFIMSERLTYRNIMANPHASYLFAEAGKFAGVRLYLTRTEEEKDPQKTAAILKHAYGIEANDEREPLHVLYFQLNKILPLLGSTEITECPHKNRDFLPDEGGHHHHDDNCQCHAHEVQAKCHHHRDYPRSK